ncbi:MAG: bifunctional metallophosphatase/5'-nucleotidase [Methanobacterium sp. BRmetb2]|nr:MAG: bifunctional metallophosphatase/5'-nucleotidase [Methanobacterium sp. BRmetb2]
MNDSHAYFDLHNELFWKGSKPVYREVGGFARINSIFNQVRQDQPDQVLVFDCGDTIHGTYAAVKSKGEALIPILNEMNFDAMTAHWEFAYGPKQFMNITRKLDYPMLAVNCYNEKNDQLIFKPYHTMEKNNLRLGIIGIAATIVDKVMPTHFSEGIYFTLGNEELSYYVEKLRNEEKVDMIIVISHLGFPQEVKLAMETEGIDVLLSAHTHNRLYKPIMVNKTVIIQSGCHGSFVGRLDLNIQGGKIKNFHHELITVEKDIEADQRIEKMVERNMKPYKDYLSQVVGYTETGLNRNTVLESTMDNFLLNSLLNQEDAQLAFSNGWRYGAPVPPGKITINDLWNIIPVNPPVSTVELEGREIWQMMEENLERTFSSDPYKQMGGYVKRCVGLNLYFKIENQNGIRIQEIFIQGKRLEAKEKYKAVFVTSQGVPEKYGAKRETTDTNAIDSLINYLEYNKSVKADLLGTITPV